MQFRNDDEEDDGTVFDLLAKEAAAENQVCTGDGGKLSVCESLNFQFRTCPQRPSVLNGKLTKDIVPRTSMALVGLRSLRLEGSGEVP